jgi:putative DNA primase/helicase
MWNRATALLIITAPPTFSKETTTHHLRLVPRSRTPAGSHPHDERSPNVKKAKEEPLTTSSDAPSPAPDPIFSAEVIGMVPNLLTYPHTDTGNAERVFALFSQSIHYCVEWKKWIIWDKKRWVKDVTLEINRCAKTTMRIFRDQTSSIKDDDAREEAKKFAKQSENYYKIDKMLTCLMAERGVCLSATEFDLNPWLLNAKNGTIDLKTGTLLPAKPSDFITKICPVEYDPDAYCPTFLMFLKRIMNGNQRMVDYLQKVFGHALTGSVTEKAVFCFHGKKGNNGKTSLLEAVSYILAEYSTSVMISSLMASEHESSSSMADLADMHGARLVTTAEAEKTHKLAEGKLKYLSGMGRIKACRKYENPFHFKPTHKLIMETNHLPKVTGTDKAIWNRLKPIPFLIEIPGEEIDKELPEKLQAEASGILAWMVRGCLKWQETGLKDALEVKESADDWRSSADDVLTEFLEDECVFDKGYFTPVAEMRSAFEEWAKNETVKNPSLADLQERLRDNGCVSARERVDGRQVRGWKYVYLRAYVVKHPLAE